MARSIANEFYRSTEWEKTRKAFMLYKNGLCERCLAKGHYEPARIVHHKIYLSEDNYKNPAVSLNFDNLEALCRDCHNKEHFADETERRYQIGKNGELIF